MDIWQRIIWLLTVLWHYRYTIVLPMLILPIGGVFIGTSLPKQYTTHTSMLIQETAKMNPFLEDFSVSTLLEERIGALKTLLHSRHILTSVAEDMGIVNGTTSAYERDAVIRQLSTKLKLSVISKDVYKLEYKDNNPKYMENTLAIASRYFIDELLTPERSSISGSENFLATQIEKNLLDLSVAEKKLAIFKDTHPNELPEYHKVNVAQLAQLKQDFSEKSAELAGEKKRLGGLSEQLSATNPIISGIEDKIIQKQSQLTSLHTRYTKEHSSIKRLMRELDQLKNERKKILASTKKIDNIKNLWVMVNNLSEIDPGELTLLMSQLQTLQENQGNVAHLEEQTKYLKKSITLLEEKLRDMGSREQELKALMRNIVVKQSLHNDLLKRYEMAKITGSLSKFESQDRVKIIDRPYTPTRPTNPPVILFVVAGLFAGLALGIGCAIIGEVTNSRVRRTDQILSIIEDCMIIHLPKV